MRRKFKIFYGAGHEKAGQRYKPKGKDMLVMNAGGVFFVYNGAHFYPSIRPLVDKIGNYDVVWNDEEVT